MLGPKVRVQASFHQGSLSPLDRAKGRPALGRLRGFTPPFSSPAHSPGPGHMPPGAHLLLFDSDLAIEIFECLPTCVKPAKGPRWSLPPTPCPLGGRHAMSVRNPRPLGVSVDGKRSEIKPVAWAVHTYALRCLMVPGGARWKETCGWAMGSFPYHRGT